MMKFNTRILPGKVVGTIETIGRLADQQGLRAYAVGGLVRDGLLKRRSLDLDITVEGQGIAFAKLVSKRLKGELTTHSAFLTATVNLSNGLTVDIVSARKETYPVPGSLPVVERSDLEDDLFRRDFTVNAMAFSINRSDLGTLVDPFFGLEDLRQRRLRVLHENSFVDDPTRLLRIARYAARLGFTLEDETMRLFNQAFTRRVWQTVKPQRYFAEFRKILLEPTALHVIRFLDDHGGLRVPVLRMSVHDNRLKSVAQALVLSKADGHIDPSLLWLMGLQDQWRTDDLAFALDHLGINRREMNALVASLHVDYLLGVLSVKHIMPSKVYERLQGIDPHVLYLAYAKARGLARLRMKRYMTRDQFASLSINGLDITRLGVKPGVEVKDILGAILAKYLDDGKLTKKEQLNVAAQMIAGSSGNAE